MANPIEKTNIPPDEIVKTPEVRALRTMFSDIDGEVNRRLTERFGTMVPAERLQKLQDLPTVFERRPDFDQSLKNAGDEVPSDGTVYGFVRENSQEAPHVALDQDPERIINTVIHERHHQLSDPRASEALGKDLYEGVTEYMARDTLGQRLESESPEPQIGAYDQETELAHQLAEVTGQDVVESAYLRGDVENLRAKLDEALGKGTLESFGAEVKEWDNLPDGETDPRA